MTDLIAEARKYRSLRKAVEGLADTLADEEASRARVAGATPCCHGAYRLRAVLAAVDGAA